MKSMKIREFLWEKLNELSKKFHAVTFSYVYDSVYNQHVVEANPEFLYKSEEFAAAQIKLELEFMQNFPEGEIMFISGKHDLDLPDFEFVINSSINYNDLKDVVLFSISSFVGLLSNPTLFQIKFDKEVLSAYNLDCVSHFATRSTEKFAEKSTFETCISTTEDSDYYTMAA